MFRRKSLCPEVRFCPDAEVENGGPNPDGPPCLNCPAAALDAFFASPDGDRYKAVMQLDFALSAGFRLTLDDITQLDFGLLMFLRTERQRYENEQLEEARNKH